MTQKLLKNTFDFWIWIELDWIGLDLDWIGLDWIEVLNIPAKALRSDLAARISRLQLLRLDDDKENHQSMCSANYKKQKHY